MLAGESVSDLAVELKMKRTFLYRWKERYRKLGAAGFEMRRGRPPKASKVGDLRTRPVEDMSAANKRIAELERKIGQQQLELDFFRQALRQVREARRSNDGPGAKPSTPASRR
jgi:transposase